MKNLTDVTPPQTARGGGSAFWVPAREVLPMGPHDVLCTDLEGVWIGCYCLGEWIRDDYPVDVVVTHWQELPDPPEQ